MVRFVEVLRYLLWISFVNDARFHLKDFSLVFHKTLVKSWWQRLMTLSYAGVAIISCPFVHLLFTFLLLHSLLINQLHAIFSYLKETLSPTINKFKLAQIYSHLVASNQTQMYHCLSVVSLWRHYGDVWVQFLRWRSDGASRCDLTPLCCLVDGSSFWGPRS